MADVLSLTDARSALRLPTADTSNDADLSATYIPAVTTIVEDVAGPIMSRTGQTWTVDGGKTSILLPSAVTAVTSVVESGATLVANVDYTVNLKSGIVTRGSTQTPYIFLPGQQNIVITYSVGYAAAAANVNANVKLAARIILAQLFQADQQGARPQFGSNDVELVSTPSGFAVPRRAYELLRATPNVPGFA
jgi:hypothetical protein